MTRQLCPGSGLTPQPLPQSPAPPSMNRPRLWRHLDPQRQHRLTAHLATLIRRHYDTINHQKEMDNEQHSVNAAVERHD